MRWFDVAVPVTAALIVAAVLRLVPWVAKRAIRDVVDETLRPFLDDFAKHMEREEAMYQRLLEQVNKIASKNARDHLAYEFRLKQLESGRSRHVPPE